MRHSEQPADSSARDRLHGLVAGGGDARGPGGDVLPEPERWVPESPLPPEPAEEARGPADDDVRAVVARMRAAALNGAATAYAADHGHPLERTARGGGARRRWYLSVRLAVVAGAAIAVLGAGVAARAALATVPVVAPIVAPAGSRAAVAISGGTPEGDQPAGESTTDPVAPDPGGATSAAPLGAVIVHVVGQVAAPGLVELPDGARVSDAVAAAGGASPGADLSAVNLARVVGDGEQIVVPAPGEVVAGVGGAGVTGDAGPGGSPGPAPVLDLNSADLADLDGLPGIGPVLAQRILDWRVANGRFTQVDELGEVTGIGDTLLERLRELVRV